MTTVYLFDHETGEIQGSMEAKLDPFGKELLPGPNHRSRTIDVPPAAQEGRVRVFDREAQAWSLVEDHRGETVYSTQDGSEKEIKDLGPLPEDVTSEPRPSQFHNWESGAWVEDLAAKQQATLASIKEQARRNIIAAIPEWKQRNMTALGVSLVRKGEPNWTAEEQSQADTLDQAWDWIKAVRTRSDELEQAARDGKTVDVDAGSIDGAGEWP